MKTLALATFTFIFALSLFFIVDCLPHSLDSPKIWLSTRSPNRSGSLCLLNRSVQKTRTTSGAEDPDEHHECSKSINSVEEDNWSGVPPSQLSSKSTGPSSHWFSKSKKAKHHPYNSKKKHHQFHSNFHPATSVKNASSTADSAGSVVNNAANAVNQTGNAVNDPGSTVNDASSAVNNPEGAVNNPEGAVNNLEGAVNNPEGAVNHPWGAGNHPWGVLNHPWGAVNNPWSGLKDPYHEGFTSNYEGKATFFYQGGNPGACGKVHEDSDFVVAIQSEMYGGGKFCGKTVLVTRKSTGKTIKCLAADECPGCPTHQSLDLSVGAFNALGNPEEGVFDIYWAVID